MSKADADEITASQIVHSMYGGKDLKFENLGQFDLKGFDEATTIYQVVWKEPVAVAAE